MKYKDINDYELLYMVKDGDEEFLDILFRKYQPIIKTKIKKWEKYSKSINLDIEDLEQELNYIVIECINNYDDSKGASFYTYITTVINNSITTIIRRHNRLKNFLLNNAISLSTPTSIEGVNLEETITNHKTVENEVIERDINFKIFAFCYEIPLTDAFVYELSINGYDVKTISILLSISTRRVNYVLTKNRKKLKNYLCENSDLCYN